ncbi:hypothetical protein Scep_006621 [Stephania cephalantha]|uniref:Uncharacterized protein n=1 Tax=Stephania cephalantha TaxID=152367 RepID=A0AAP0PME5_9MAGN
MMVEGGVEELAAEVGGAWVGLGSRSWILAEVGAQGGVVGEEAASEADEDGGVERVDGVGRVRRRIRALARWRTRCSRRLRTLSRRGGIERSSRRRSAERGLVWGAGSWISAEVGAPGGVVREEAAAEADEDGGVERVDGVGRVRRRIRALASGGRDAPAGCGRCRAGR